MRENFGLQNFENRNTEEGTKSLRLSGKSVHPRN